MLNNTEFLILQEQQKGRFTQFCKDYAF